MNAGRILVLILVSVAALLMVFLLSTNIRGVAIEPPESGHASAIRTSALMLHRALSPEQPP